MGSSWRRLLSDASSSEQKAVEMDRTFKQDLSHSVIHFEAALWKWARTAERASWISILRYQALRHTVQL